MKSTLFGVLFFNNFIGAVGLTTEPTYAYDERRLKYEICYINYIDTEEKVGYMVTLTDPTKRVKLYGYILWDIWCESQDPYCVEFLHRFGNRTRELFTDTPFPTMSRRKLRARPLSPYQNAEDFHEGPSYPSVDELAP